MKSKNDLNIVRNFKKDKTRDGILKLRKDVDKIARNYEAKVWLKIKEAVNNYPTDWDEIFDEIYTLFESALEKSYAKASSSLKQIYGEITPYDISDIKDLTYTKDGITLEERLDKYKDKAAFNLKMEVEKSKVIDYLVYHYTLIMDTETKNLESAVKKNKKPIPPPGAHAIQVIEGCGGDCNGSCLEYNGIYPEDEDVPWPPYHPGCTGVAYYDVTDDLDEINDLDLEETDLDEPI